MRVCSLSGATRAGSRRPSTCFLCFSPSEWCGWIERIASWTKSNERDYVEATTRFSNQIHVATTYLCEALRVKELVQLKPKLTLSPRERECLLWVQAGRSTKQISERLTICDATVNEYIALAMTKLDASNRIQAAARATMLGLIQP